MRYACTRLLLALLVAAPAFTEQRDIDRAQQLLAKGALPEAVEVLDRLVKAKPDDEEVRRLLGTALALEGKRTESLEQLHEAVRLRPDSAPAWNALGMAFSRFAETAAAREAFENALKLDPKMADAHVNLALILAQSNEMEAAGQDLDRAIELWGNAPASAYAHYLRAKIWNSQGEEAKATAELEKAVSVRPDYAEAWSDLGGMRRLAMDDDGARVALEKAVRLNPRDALAQYRLGLEDLKNGKAAKAVPHLRQSLAKNPNDRAALYNLNRALLASGEPEEAARVSARLAESLRLTEQSGANSMVAAKLDTEGVDLERSGDVRGAVQKYRQALDLDPANAGLHLNYGLALCRLNQWREGIVELEEVLRLDPDNANAMKALYIAREQASKSPVRSALPK